MKKKRPVPQVHRLCGIPVSLTKKLREHRFLYKNRLQVYSYASWLLNDLHYLPWYVIKLMIDRRYIAPRKKRAHGCNGSPQDY